MANIRDRNDYQENASSLHKRVGELLSSGVFSLHKVFQEYLVSDINPRCPNPRLRVDWYIPSLHLAIEVQGQQHKEIVDFGGKGIEKARALFSRSLQRDAEKARLLAEAGIALVEVWFDQALNEQILLKLISDALRDLTPKAQVAKKKSTIWKPPPEVLQKSRERQKEMRKRINDIRKRH